MKEIDITTSAALKSHKSLQSSQVRMCMDLFSFSDGVYNEESFILTREGGKKATYRVQTNSGKSKKDVF